MKDQNDCWACRRALTYDDGLWVSGVHAGTAECYRHSAKKYISAA